MEQKKTRERLGLQLAAARREKGWTLTDLGQRTGNAASRLSGIENGKFNATVDALAQVGEAAGLALTFVPTERMEEIMTLIGRPSITTAYPTVVRSLHDDVFIPDPSEEEESMSGNGRP